GRRGGRNGGRGRPGASDRARRAAGPRSSRVSVAPPHLAGDERAWQDDVGGGLQEAAYARAGTREGLGRQHQRIAAAPDAGPGLPILDLGCGVGHLLAWLSRHAPATYHGFDLSLTSIRAARMVAAVDVGVGDAGRLPFRDASYDRVICNGSAHHLPDVP